MGNVMLLLQADIVQDLRMIEVILPENTRLVQSRVKIQMRGTEVRSIGTRTGVRGGTRSKPAELLHCGERNP